MDINNVGKVFSSRLGQLMQKGVDEKKVTQQDLATATGYTRQAISQYLDGSVLPNIEKLYTFAKYFNVSADYLVGLTDTPTTDRDVRFIGDYTGLNETAINGLHNLIVCASEGESDSKKDLHVINGVIALFKKEAANELALG